ncbi:MAG: endonuclease V [Nannocystaceae bacterium]
MPNSEQKLVIHGPIACFDVDYRDTVGRCACLTFDAFSDPTPSDQLVVDVPGVADYQSGEFFRRELPVVLAVLAKLPTRPRLIVVDGYVWLAAGTSRPGFGAYLYNALGCEVPVIGVAKNSFAGAPAAEVLRGSSRRPLYVTSAGISIEQAVQSIRDMHGKFRLPTLLKQVDRLSRDGIPT